MSIYLWLLWFLIAYYVSRRANRINVAVRSFNSIPKSSRGGPPVKLLSKWERIVGATGAITLCCIAFALTQEALAIGKTMFI